MGSLLRQRMVDDLRIRHYSPRTIEIYTACIREFARHFGTSPERLGPDEIRTYQRFLVDEKQVSWASFNQTVSALRFLYGVTLDRKDVTARIPYPKHETKLPVVLSREEVGRFLGAVRNLKHRTILMTLYGAGLRLNEALALMVTDVDSARMVIRVQQGKGRKDRYVDLSATLLAALRAYWKVYHPRHCLFPGRAVDHPLDPTAVQRVCTAGATAGGPPEVGQSPYAAALLRDASVGSRQGPAHDSSAAGTPGAGDDRAVSPCRGGPVRCPEPGSVSARRRLATGLAGVRRAAGHGGRGCPSSA